MKLILKWIFTCLLIFLITGCIADEEVKKETATETEKANKKEETIADNKGAEGTANNDLGLAPDIERYEVKAGDDGITAYVLNEGAYLANSAENFDNIRKYRMAGKSKELQQLLDNNYVVTVPVDTKVEVLKTNGDFLVTQVYLPEYEVEGYMSRLDLYKTQ